MSLPGKAWKDPLKLCPCIRAKYLTFYEQAKQAEIALVTIETLRDVERQKAYLAMGVSQTMRSKHLPQPPYGLSLAFDVAPKAYLKLKGWAPGAPKWQQMVGIGEGLGLTAGGAWPKFKDWPHFQLVECACEDALPADQTLA